MNLSGSSAITARLQAVLTAALGARDTIAVSAARSALAAIGNAEAIAAPAEKTAQASSQHFAGAAAGLRAADVPRRVLTHVQIEQIVMAEIAERRDAARLYEEAQRRQQAERLRREADVLSAVLAESD